MATPNLLVTPERFQLVLDVNEDCTVELTNVGYEAIIFRLLTTAPERYTVRHTKGVIRGNTSMKASIALNRKAVAEEQQKQQAEGGSKVLKDDFRVEYCLLGENDIVEPKFSNVPALIKEKKEANPASVVKKMIRCHLLLDPNATDASSLSRASAERNGSEAKPAGPSANQANPTNTNNNAAAAANATNTAAAAAKNAISAAQLEKGTLDAKNLRQEVGKGKAVGSSSNSSARMKLLVVAVLLLALLLWILFD